MRRDARWQRPRITPRTPSKKTSNDAHQGRSRRRGGTDPHVVLGTRRGRVVEAREAARQHGRYWPKTPRALLTVIENPTHAA